MKTRTLIEASHLSVSHRTSDSVRCIVNDVNFVLEGGGVLCIVGESGSGKTTLCRSLTRLFPKSSGLKIEGVVRFGDHDLLSCDEEALREIRMRSLRYIFQEPQEALNPLLTIRNQLRFASGGKVFAEQEYVDVLKSVGLHEATEVLHRYPHQLSVGMAQRVMIAMAILPKPALLIADELTSAVDSSLRFRLLDLLKSLQQQYSMAMILVTHDLEIARRYADEVAVMMAGRIVEHNSVEVFFRTPQHEYSKQLVEAMNPMDWN